MAATIEIDSIATVVLAVSGLLALASPLAVATQRVRIPLTLLLVLVGFAEGELAPGVWGRSAR